MTEAIVPRAWAVGALCQAIAQALASRFNPVVVEGEVSGWSRASSGHCYFSLKDANGQLRCAMFRRAAAGLEFAPRDGELVSVHGRLAVYEPRGDLQLVVERMTQAGAGNLFEAFLRLKERLEAQGLFDVERKRPIRATPRTLGVVTSLGAAALHDVLTALQRRAPHVRVVIAPASVQGAGAPAELAQALTNLAQWRCPASGEASAAGDVGVDTILLVRGGGSLEDLWAFNDELLVRTIAASPIPVVTGIGHETDFTLCDFTADLRAPTPTAAAEIVSQSRDELARGLDRMQRDLQDGLEHYLQRQAQRLDLVTQRVGRPAGWLAQQNVALARIGERLPGATRNAAERASTLLAQAQLRLRHAVQTRLRSEHDRLNQRSAQLEALNPRWVLRRGFAWLKRSGGAPLTHAADAQPGQDVQAVLVDGALDLRVTSVWFGES